MVTLRIGDEVQFRICRYLARVPAKSTIMNTGINMPACRNTIVCSFAWRISYTEFGKAHAAEPHS